MARVVGGPAGGGGIQVLTWAEVETLGAWSLHHCRKEPSSQDTHSPSPPRLNRLRQLAPAPGP